MLYFNKAFNRFQANNIFVKFFDCFILCTDPLDARDVATSKFKLYLINTFIENKEKFKMTQMLKLLMLASTVVMGSALWTVDRQMKEGINLYNMYSTCFGQTYATNHVLNILNAVKTCQEKPVIIFFIDFLSCLAPAFKPQL